MKLELLAPRAESTVHSMISDNPQELMQDHSAAS